MNDGRRQMRRIVLVAAMVLVSAGAQAGGSRSLSLTVSDSKAVQDSAKTVEPASAVNTPRVPKSANAASGEATGSTGVSERQKFAERPPGVDVRRQSQMQQSRMRGQASQRRASQHMAGMGMRKPVHVRMFSKARIVAVLHRHGIYW
jgi:hypothetical protein